MLKQYDNEFEHLHVFQSSQKWPNFNGKAPHKPILLLTVIELIDSRHIRQNLISITPELQAAFYRNWSTLAGRKPRALDLMLPFFHLRGDGFWHLVPQRGMSHILSGAFHPTSLSRLKQLVVGATLDPELFNLLQEPAMRTVFSTILTRTYLMASDATKSSIPPNPKHSMPDVAHSPLEHLNEDEQLDKEDGLRTSNITVIALLTDACRTLLDLAVPHWQFALLGPLMIDEMDQTSQADDLGIRTFGDLECLTTVQLIALARRKSVGFESGSPFWSRVLVAARSYAALAVARLIEQTLFQKSPVPQRNVSSMPSLHESQDSLADRARESSALLQPSEDVLLDPRICHCRLLSEQAIADILQAQPYVFETPLIELIVRHRSGVHTVEHTPSAAQTNAQNTLRIGDVVRQSPAQLFSIPGFGLNSYHALIELLREQLGPLLGNVVQSNAQCAGCRRDQNPTDDEVGDLLALADLYGVDCHQLRVDALVTELDMALPVWAKTQTVSAVLQSYTENTFRQAVSRAVIRRLVASVLQTESAAIRDESVAELLRTVTIESLIKNLLARAETVASGSQKRRSLELSLERFGVWDGKFKSMAAVGTEVGLSRERIRQLDLKARECLRSVEMRPYTEGLIGLICEVTAATGGTCRAAKAAEHISTLLPFGAVHPEMCVRWLAGQVAELTVSDDGWIIAQPYSQSDVDFIEQHAVLALTMPPEHVNKADSFINYLQTACENASIDATVEFVRAVLCSSTHVRLVNGIWKLAYTEESHNSTVRDIAQVSDWVVQILKHSNHPLHWDELLQSLRPRSPSTALLLGECLTADETIHRFDMDYYGLPGRSYALPLNTTPSSVGLTAEQTEIAEASPSAKILVTADPGTGKTHVLIARLASLISKYELSPGQELLVLSFSRAAVREIKHRTSTASNDVRFVHAFTFDSFATRLLAEVDPAGSWVDQDYDSRIRAAIDMIGKSADARDIVSSYLHVLVDEVQDLVGDRAELVKALLGACGGGFTLFGDPAQGIYNWTLEGEARRIGSGALYEWLRWRFGAGLQEKRLTQNYRATTAQAKTALALGLLLRDSQRDPEHVRVELNHLMGEVPQLGKIDDIAAILRISRVPTALLCRNNGQALLMSRKLFELGVPHRIQSRSADRIVPKWVAVVLSSLDSSRIGKTAFVEAYKVYQSQVTEYESPNLPDAETAWEILKSMDRATRDVLNVGNVADRIRTGYIPDELLGSSHEHIVVSTIHRAKGMEFDRVIVVGDSELYTNDDSAAEAEELRVMFVALTRAKRELYRIQPLSLKGLFPLDTADRWIRRRQGWRTLNFEVRGDDVDRTDPLSGFIIDGFHARSVQDYIRSYVKPGDPVTLSRYVTESSKQHALYLLKHDKHPVGATSESFARALTLALKINPAWRVKWPENWPADIEDLQVETVDTVGWAAEATRRCGLGESGLWLRVRVSGLGRLVFGSTRR